MTALESAFMLSTFTLSVAMSLMATDEQAPIDSNAVASNTFFRLNISFSSSKRTRPSGSGPAGSLAYRPATDGSRRPRSKYARAGQRALTLGDKTLIANAASTADNTDAAG